MFEYTVLNGLVLLLAGVYVIITAKKHSLHLARMYDTTWIKVATSLFLMTAIFDSFIVGQKIVAYDTSKILGVYIYKAPIEDFFYIFAALLLVPLLWSIIPEKDKRRDDEPKT